MPVTLFALALLVRLAALAFAKATGRFPEFWEYDDIARNLIAGKGFVHTFLNVRSWAFAEPPYPLLIAGVYLVTGFSVTALALVQCLLSALLAPVIFQLGRSIFDRRTGLISGALVAVNPALAGFATKFHPLTLDALLIALTLLTSMRLRRHATTSSAVQFGVIAGIGMLSRPTILAFVIAAAVLMAWRERNATARHVALAVAVALLVIGSWVARNYAVLGSFVLTRSYVGYALWLGNQPRSLGDPVDASDPAGVRPLFEAAPTQFKQEVLSQTNEIDQDRMFRNEAVRYIKETPMQFVAGFARKLYYFWSFPPHFGALYARWQSATSAAFYLALAFLALVGLLAARIEPVRGQREDLTSLLILLITVSATQAVFFVQGRHRIGLEPILSVLSGRGLVLIGGAVHRIAHRTLRC